MKRKTLSRGKGKFLKRLFSAVLVIALLSTGVYTDVSDVSADQGNVNSNGVSDNGLLAEPALMPEGDTTVYANSVYGDGGMYSDPVYEDDGMYSDSVYEDDVTYSDSVYEDAVMYAEGDAQYLATNETKDIFEGTTITLNNVTLKASYQDESGKTQVVELNQNDTYELPYNVGIHMELNFVLGSADAILDGKVCSYVYKIPEGIRVDVETTHDLADSNGKSIGKVHISRDGTLTFYFDKEKITSQDVPFYVWFDGSLSEENRDKGKHIDLKFPASSGSFDFHIDTTDKKFEEEKPEPGAITMEKYGSRVVNVNGQNYIEWTVSLGANGRDSITGTIHDVLPKGLSYASFPIPKVEGCSTGRVETKTADGAGTVDIEVIDCKPYWRANVTFYTYYDEDVFGDAVINNQTEALIENTATFEPEDDSAQAVAKGKVTFKPDILSKSGNPIDADGNITWTVVINNEGLDIGGCTYEDIIGPGQKLEGEVSAPGLTVTKSDTGFKIVFPEGDRNTYTYTLTYTTKVVDFDQRNFNNTGTLTGGNYNITDSENVRGITLIEKEYGDYNSITHRFTWRIIVNSENREMNGVIVTDYFDASSPMKFVSASVVGQGPIENTGSNGQIQFQLGNIKEKKIIEVVTEINPDEFNENEWKNFINHAYVVSSLNKTPVEDTASGTIQIAKPNLMDKSNKKMDDGTVEWHIAINESQLAVEGLTLTDVIPDGMAYVEGTFRLQTPWHDANPAYRKPDINGNTIFYELSEEDLNLYKDEYGKEKAFWIVYSTKVEDWTNADDEKKEYTNEAKVSITYEGDVTVTDKDKSTVTGVVGGVLDKTYDYRKFDEKNPNATGTGRDVKWTVTINEARNDMSGIKNPKIYDELADYFDYVSGELYELGADGKKTPVPAKEYSVTVVNGQIIVELPNIGEKCYQFEFTTRFNCLAAELEGKRITNTVVFDGDGKRIEKESNSIDSVNFSSSSAGAVTRTEIRVKKIDSTTGQVLEGARFQLLRGEEVLGEAVSDENGYAIFKNHTDLSRYNLQLKEIQAPDGYQKPEKPENPIDIDYDQLTLKIDNGIRYYEIDVPNTPKELVNTGTICVSKVNESGKSLPGAVIGLYKNKDFESEGSLLETRTTDTSGIAAFSRYEKGTYYLKEISPPPGYKLLNSDAVMVEIKADNDGNIQVTYGGQRTDACKIINTPAVGTLKITKVEKGKAEKKISGVTFAIYDDSNCSNMITSGTTDDNGVVELGGLTLGKIYYYREIAAPKDYVLDNTIRTITVGKGTETTDLTVEKTIENEPAIGNIVITKTDDSIPAKKLSDVEFTLCDKSGVVLKDAAGNEIKALTGSDGVVVFKDIPFGNYVIKETGKIDGYTATIGEEGKTIAVKQTGNTNVTIVNKVIKRDITIVKMGSDSTEDNRKFLSGVTFELWTKGQRVRSGITDKDGKLVFRDVPYGDYIVKEVKAPEGYKIADDWIISSDDFNHELNRTILDYKQDGAIKVTKKNESGDSLSGAEFTLYDENKFALTQETSDGDGIAMFTGLPYGTYYVRETKAPDGYIMDGEFHKVEVTKDYKPGEVDSRLEEITVVNQKSEAPYISVKLLKIDRATDKPLSDATFVMYADRNDGNGDVKIATAVTGTGKDAGIAYFRQVQIRYDPDGTVYTIKETLAPTGYNDPDSDKIIWQKVKGEGNDSIGSIEGFGDPPNGEGDSLEDDDIKWLDGRAGDIEPSGAAIVDNNPIMGSIKITKTGMVEENPPLPGAEYTLYDKNRTPVDIPGVKNPASTDDNGEVVFDNLPCGIYYVKETKAPQGYTLSNEETQIVINSEEPVPKSYKDKPIEVWISKQAVGGNAEIPGAEFVIKEKGKEGIEGIIDSWTSNDKNPHRVIDDKTKKMPSRLEVGKIYTLSEIEAPPGHGYMRDVDFTVNSDGSITVIGDAERNGKTIVVRDQPINLSISKVTLSDQEEELANARLVILDADGKGIHWFTTNGVAPYEVPMGVLTAPEEGYNKYTLQEISPPDGYEYAEDIEFSVDRYGNVYLDTNEPVNLIRMVDEPKDSIYLRKLDAVTRLDIPKEAEFQIYNGSGEPLLDADGKEILLTTKGRPLDIGQYLTNNETYIIEEINPPVGYLKAKPVKFKYQDGHLSIEDGSADNLNRAQDTLMIYDRPIELKIRKQDNYGLLLAGATLRISEYNEASKMPEGLPIVEFESDGQQSYTVSPELLSSGKYILQEMEPPANYKTAEDIVFRITDDGIIIRTDNVPVFNNTIVMEDKEGGVHIGKFDLDNGDSLPGCVLKLEAKDDKWWKNTKPWESDVYLKTWDIEEFTPGCTYVLTEVTAPAGYAYTDPITFMIGKDDHKVYINGELQEDGTVRIKDGKIKLTVSKQDFYDHTEVPGAELSILDKEGKVLASWVSGSEPCAVDTSKLIASSDSYEEYILREVKAPKGYNKADDIPFAIDRDGNIYLVQGDGQYTLAENNMLTMYDDPMLTVSKLDTAGNPVVGAKLTVTAKEDPNFKPISWETTAERHTFEDGAITPGVTYILTETEAPDGYGYGQSLEFMVDADNNVFVNGQKVDNRRVVMLDKLITVNVSKMDGDSTRHLAGAKLAIRNETGAIIYTFTSTDTAVLIPKEIFKAVQGGTSYYTLSEIEAPKGYLKAQDIAFAISGSGNLLQKKADGTYVVSEDGTLVMKDYAEGSAPKTGDGTPLRMMIALCITGFLGTCTIFGWYFKRRRKRAKA